MICKQNVKICKVLSIRYLKMTINKTNTTYPTIMLGFFFQVECSSHLICDSLCHRLCDLPSIILKIWPCNELLQFHKSFWVTGWFSSTFLVDDLVVFNHVELIFTSMTHQCSTAKTKSTSYFQLKLRFSSKHYTVYI